MSVPPTDPRYSTEDVAWYRARPKPALTALLILLAFGLIALLGWWIF